MGALNTDPKDWLSAKELEYLKDHVVMSDTQLVTLRWQTFTLMDINSRFQFNFIPTPAAADAASARKEGKGNPILPYSDRALRDSIYSFSPSRMDHPPNTHSPLKLPPSCSDLAADAHSPLKLPPSSSDLAPDNHSPLKLPSNVRTPPAGKQRRNKQTGVPSQHQKSKAAPSRAPKKRSQRRSVPDSEEEEAMEASLSERETSLDEMVPTERRTSSRKRRAPKYPMDDLLKEDPEAPPPKSPKSPKSPASNEVKLKKMMPVIYDWPEDPCGVCGFADWDDENMIIMCDGKNCNVLVHIGCHGFTTVPEEDPWFCDICSAKLNPRNSNCALCPVTGGVLKRVSKLGMCAAPDSTSSTSLFVHTCCALWNPNIAFENPSKVMDVDLSRLTQARVNQQCCVCQQGGGTIQCGFRRCRTTFHVLCGRSKKFKGALREDGCTLMLCEKHSFDSKFAEGRVELLGDRNS